ncbi:nitrite/sulfite reductase [Kineosporia sp. A_224]|uniref:nitrite/sulfite reductase n=1 Tax=Kineosporia sp. A_224 TaxID=1962180 RepID=UPI000B4BDEE5|nr:nitrite/sulfite reductase [Kineosporia sp. A_224]
MTDTDSAPPAEPTAARPARAGRTGRPEGQWALGQTEPLNANEAWKQREGGLAVKDRIVSTYAAEGFASIPGEDLRGRMRWWGLYTQRRPGIDGGRTASLEPEELDDEYFMLRVRIDGGRVSLTQLRTLADISKQYARGTADVTDRQNIQYHWIRIEDMPAIWEALEAVGLGTTEACGDVPRTVLGSPVAGAAADEIVDGTPAIDEIVRRWIGDPELANLPRKFKTGVSGSPHHDVAHEIQDIAFVGIDHPEYGPGFDLWVGGGLSTTPILGQRLGAFVPLEDVAEVWHGVVRIFRDYGYRRLRNRARLKFLMADWGPEKFREVLETEYLGRKLQDGPPPPPPPLGRTDHVGVHKQKRGRFYVGVAPVVGRVSGDMLHGLADAAQRAGSDRIRFTPEQKVVVLDVEAPKVADLVDDLEAVGLSARASTFRRGTMACTGLEFCKLAIVETKATGARLVAELERRLADVPELFTADAPALTINVNGCPNSCARAQIADIGLKGVQLPNPADPQGPTVEGFQISLGGGLGAGGGIGRKLRGLKTTSADLPDYVERVVRRWLDQRADDESFAAWVARAAATDLA